MFEDPHEPPAERANDPLTRAAEKAAEIRMHAELAAVYEGGLKFDAAVLPGFDAEQARDVQQAMAKLEKAKSPESPVLPADAVDQATRVLAMAGGEGPSTSDYHVRRRPGEVMIIRWLVGDEVEAFYDRMQAHVDAALAGYVEEQRQSHGWKQDAGTLAYFDALEKQQPKAAERYLREPIRTRGLCVLSTQTADEMNIAFLAEHLMGIGVGELVGDASAPPDNPTDRDLAWFFKLFALRGTIAAVERMCFFTYLQKSGDDDSW